ncbi:hypothetical protein Bbelb_296450 [Branchiostoma belcheri]|nr:hypothetical protein Bbelb_296450 [Branchiostoma belcheri]
MDCITRQRVVVKHTGSLPLCQALLKLKAEELYAISRQQTAARLNTVTDGASRERCEGSPCTGFPRTIPALYSRAFMFTNTAKGGSQSPPPEAWQRLARRAGRARFRASRDIHASQGPLQVPTRNRRYIASQPPCNLLKKSSGSGNNKKTFQTAPGGTTPLQNTAIEFLPLSTRVPNRGLADPRPGVFIHKKRAYQRQTPISIRALMKKPALTHAKQRNCNKQKLTQAPVKPDISELRAKMIP